MTDPRRPNSLRYPGFDYSPPAGIFVTLATHDRQQLFGSSDEGLEGLTIQGKAVHQRWTSIPNRFPDVKVDAFAIMPDHIHGILWMGCADVDQPASCGDVIRWFKSAVLSDYSKGVAQGG